MICKNCTTEITSNYCPNCGRQATLKRIDSHYLIHEISHVLHFEKGILHTVKELLTQPGKTVREFITDDRSRLVKPVIFIIITSLIYSIVAHLFHIHSFISFTDNQDNSTATKIFEWGDGHSGYMNIIIGVFIAIWAKLFFRKQKYNLFEILILLCFITGMTMLIFSLFAVAEGLIHIPLMAASGVIGIVYCTWAIGQFFGPNTVLTYIKAFSAYVLGLLTFSIIIIIVGGIIDTIIK